MVKKFRWKLAGITLLKTFIISFFTPLGMIEWVFRAEMWLTLAAAASIALVSTGLMFGQVLERYLRMQGVNNNGY